MNCQNCNTPMIAKPMFGERVTVSHVCPNCQHRHVVTFDKPETEYNPFKAQTKPVSKVGHVLTTRYMGQDTPRYVIGQYRNWKKVTIYVLSQWNDVSQRFIEIAENDFLFERSTMSKAAYVMPEAIKAMSRAYRLIEILRLLHKRLHRVGSGVVDCQKIIAQTSYRGRFDMLDKTGYVFENEPDFLFGNAQIKAETIALQKKLADRWHEEMVLAGIFNEAS